MKHEVWVHETLENKPREAPKVAPVKRTRFKSEIPAQLPMVTSGKALLDLALGCFGQYPYFGDDLTDEEMDLVGGFIEAVQDWGDVLDGSEVVEIMRAGKAIDAMIVDLAEHGFLVFAAVERQRLEGGVGPSQMICLLHLSVARGSDRSVVVKEDGNEMNRG
ncbi:hypothetical protein [Dyella japonica]|uniref:hypothetical protein n=1 Tax=Dyella japonica TaxID=231455 RepID=UPI001FCD3CC6|nr:hypothetical protein [Dyella japonica]